MLSALWTGLKVILAVLNVFGWVSRWLDRRRAREEGRMDASLKSHEQQVENVTKAKRAAARVRTDGELRSRVRKRYTTRE